MWLLYLLFVIAGPAVVWFLSRTGESLRREAAAPLVDLDASAWPRVGMIIPAAGSHPAMKDAISTLLAQKYPGEVTPVIVTATDTEPAADLVRLLQKEYPEVQHVIAGQAGQVGQKNHNSLAGVARLGNSVDVYAFCDSTHYASPDFLRRLLTPLATGEADFTTGYHEVVPQDEELVTLSYTMCVLVMRLMQGVAKLTEPWGGAMAIRRTVFESAGIGNFWSTNVVDDCSLTTYLGEKGVSVRLCPGALLRTRAHRHEFGFWKAWLERQILFLKFCVRPQWYALGLFALVAAAAPGLSFLSLLFLLVGHGCLPWLVGTAAFLVFAALASARLRPMVAHHVRMLRWLEAYCLTAVMFFVCFLATVRQKGILWHGIFYEVGERGQVLSVRRPG